MLTTFMERRLILLLIVMMKQADNWQGNDYPSSTPNYKGSQSYQRPLENNPDLVREWLGSSLGGMGKLLAVIYLLRMVVS